MKRIDALLYQELIDRFITEVWERELTIQQQAQNLRGGDSVWFITQPGNDGENFFSKYFGKKYPKMERNHFIRKLKDYEGDDIPMKDDFLIFMLGYIGITAPSEMKKRDLRKSRVHADVLYREFEKQAGFQNDNSANPQFDSNSNNTQKLGILDELENIDNQEVPETKTSLSQNINTPHDNEPVDDKVDNNNSPVVSKRSKSLLKAALNPFPRGTSEIRIRQHQKAIGLIKKSNLTDKNLDSPNEVVAQSTHLAHEKLEDNEAVNFALNINKCFYIVQPHFKLLNYPLTKHEVSADNFYKQFSKRINIDAMDGGQVEIGLTETAYKNLRKFVKPLLVSNADFERNYKHDVTWLYLDEVDYYEFMFSNKHKLIFRYSLIFKYSLTEKPQGIRF